MTSRIWVALALVWLLSACSVNADGETGFSMHDPVREAEATRVAIAAQDETAQRAVERQITQAQADKAKVEAEAARNALPAITLRNTLIYTGSGVGVVVLLVGSAFAVVAWMNKRATAIYPNTAGLYPVIVKRSWNGVTIVHDPNRALGPTTLYTTPGLASMAFDKLGLPCEQPMAAFPSPGSEQAMLQVATQAQAVGLMTAATSKGEEGVRVAQVAKKLVGSPAMLDNATARMPTVRVVDSSDEIERAVRVYLSEGK